MLFRGSPLSKPALQQRLARAFKLHKSPALRVTYWLKRLYEADLVHSDCGLVPYTPESEPIRSLVCTVDWDQRAIGCSWCGEWAADSGQPLDKDFKLIVLAQVFLPHDVRNLGLRPAVLYCNGCFAQHRDQFVSGFDAVFAPTPEGEAPETPALGHS